MKKILIIPHVGISGGAGLYIAQVIGELEKNYEINIGGMFSDSYKKQAFLIPYLLNKMVLPYYEGVSIKVCLFYLLKSIIYLPQAFFRSKGLGRKSDFELIVLTSGIQILLLPLIRLIFKESKILILVQENYRFDGLFLGSISRYLFLKTNMIVSITESWKEYARSHDIASILYRNMYNSDYNNKSNKEKLIDFIYVGGDQKIKGYSDIVVFCEKVSNIRNSSIVILGDVSLDSKMKLSSISDKSYFKLDIIFLDFIDDISNVIASSRILLLPIMAAHFCRPAIESGFQNVPFIIRKHDGIGDFAIQDYNCKMYEDVDEMVSIAMDLLNDIECIEVLGSNNNTIAKRFKYDSLLGESFLKYIDKVLR